MSSVVVDKLCVVEKSIWNGWYFSPAINQPYPATQVSVPWFILPSDYVPTLDIDTFAIIKTQPSNMQGEHNWSSSRNRWCQNYYNLITASAVSTRYMQFFGFSSSEKKEILDFTMLMYFQLWATTCNVSFIATEKVQVLQSVCYWLYYPINFFEQLYNLFT